MDTSVRPEGAAQEIAGAAAATLRNVRRCIGRASDRSLAQSEARAAVTPELCCLPEVAPSQQSRDLSLDREGALARQSHKITRSEY